MRGNALRAPIYFSEPLTQWSLEALETAFIALEAANDVKTFGAIKAVFERVCGHLVFDARLAKKVIDFQVEFVTKNEDHMAFFGGVVTGVHVVRFTSADMNRFFADVLQINELELEDELHQLRAVVAERKVSGDVFNHVCLWLVHKFLNEKTLDPKVSKRAALAAALVLNYRYLTSLLSWYYKFPANAEDAQAAYSRLTKRSAIKQYGSWHALLEARCMDFFPAPEGSGEKPGLHYKTIKDYDNDFGIIYALNDSQGRIRSMMKHLMGELKAAQSAGARTRSTSSTVELDGEGFLKDKAKGLGTYVQYVYTILPNEHTFIKQEILEVLSEAVHTAPPHMVRETLKWMSDHYKTVKGKVIDGFVQEVLVHSFQRFEDHRSVVRETTDMPALIMNLKGVYMSSRSTDPRLMQMRDMAEEITKAALPTRNPSTVAAVRTAIMLYIVVRALSMQHYSK